MTLERKTEKKNWETFINEVFEGVWFWWVFGNQSIGKSTIVKNIIHELQQKQKPDDKKQYLYLNLEKENDDSQFLVAQLRKTLVENANKGIKSCVVLGMWHGAFCFLAVQFVTCDFLL